MRTSHHILTRRLFSNGEMLQLDGSRLRPSALESATAVPTIPPLPNIEVLGLPQTLMRIASTVEIPGERNSSEFNASLAWFQMKRISGTRPAHASFGELFQYTSEFAYRQHNKAGEIFCLCVEYAFRNDASSNNGKHRFALWKKLGCFY